MLLIQPSLPQPCHTLLRGPSHADAFAHHSLGWGHADPFLYQPSSDDLTSMRNTSIYQPRNRSVTVRQAMKSHLRALETRTGTMSEGEPFYVVDLGYVYRQHLLWESQFSSTTAVTAPRSYSQCSQKEPADSARLNVAPFYAIKASPDIRIIRLLASLGCGFDCASAAEMRLVRSLNIAPQRIIFANPCKSKADIRCAKENGVRLMTFDNSDELKKIRDIYPGADLVVRIRAGTRDGAQICFANKYGVDLKNAQRLMIEARELAMAVVGVSFHVGTGAKNAAAYVDAIGNAKAVIDIGNRLGHSMKILDIGGGWSEETFLEHAPQVQRCLQGIEQQNIRIIAEPGRYFVKGAMTLACNVIARRGPQEGELATEEKQRSCSMIYLNDGIYGDFLDVALDYEHPIPYVLHNSQGFFPSEDSNTEHDYTVWGPTCDSTDCINSNITLRNTIEVGDWLYFNNMGAYTSCFCTSFNGFVTERKHVYISSEAAVGRFVGE